MKSNLFKKKMSACISREGLSLSRLFMHSMEGVKAQRTRFPDEFSPESVRDSIFTGVVRDMAGKPTAEEIKSRPEETVLALIRDGIPKDCISVCFKYLTVDLPNAQYRLFKDFFALPGGSVRIFRNGCSVLIQSGLAPEELAQFLILLDAGLPEIDKAAEALYRDLQLLFLKKQQENMALEIVSKAVEAQLDNTLPVMGISGKFKIVDGKVRLHLTRIYSGDVELPLEALQDFLSKPELIESALKVEPVPAEPEKTPDFPRPFPPSFFRSNIVINPK